MLQSLRDNLKGTVAIVIITIFAVPMVLFGVEQLFVGSLGGNDVATVDGEAITRTELNREIYLQKQRILAQSDIDPGSEMLQDENLRQPVLQRLIRRTAVLNAAREGGMAAAEEALWQEIVQQPQFQGDDGSFSQTRFRQLVTSMGYTPATYLQALTDDVILNQQSRGISQSAFVTEQELNLIVALAQQTRSYFGITISRDSVEEDITLTQEDVAAFYEENQEQFELPERVAVNYISTDLEALAERQNVSEADLRQQYEQEIATFNAQPRYEISHILIEDSDSSAERVQQVQSALKEGGEKFGEIAQQYSDDLGSRDEGGRLGLYMEDAFPEAFNQVVTQLAEGEVSGPVETEAGIHFIKLDKKQVPNVPSFAERRDALEQELRQSLARQKLSNLRERMDELTYSASNLEAAAEALDLEVHSTDLFSRDGETAEGLAQQSAVRQAAFSDEVLQEGHNSPVLELPGGTLAVVRVVQHEPERVRPFDEVAGQAREQLLARRIEESLAKRVDAVRAELESGKEPAEVAEAHGYELSRGENVSRSDMAADRRLLQQLFSMPSPGGEEPVLADLALGGDAVVIGLTDVQPGAPGSMEEAQLAAMRAQLARQTGNFEATSYESQVATSAEVQTE